MPHSDGSAAAAVAAAVVAAAAAAVVAAAATVAAAAAAAVAATVLRWAASVHARPPAHAWPLSKRGEARAPSRSLPAPRE